MTDGPGGSDTWAAPDSPAPGTFVAPEARSPDSVEPELAPGAAPGGWSTEASARRDGGTVARLPVPLRPMTAADMLDGAWTVLKLRARTVFGVTAVILLPLELLAALVQWGAPGRVDWATLFSDPQSVFNGLDQSTNSAGGLARAAAAGILGWLGYALLGGALGRLITSWYVGVEVDAREALASMGRHLWPLLGAFFLLLPLKAVAAVPCYLGSLFVVPLFACTSPAIVVEHLGPWRGPRRSFDLVRRRLFPAIWIVVLSVIVEVLVFAAVAFVPLVLSAFVPEAVRPILGPTIEALGRFLTAPVVVGVTVLLYIDLRVRSEGLDIELAATDVFGPVA